MSTKHTPGPWVLYSPHPDEQYVDVALPETLENGTDMRPVFRVHHDRTIPQATAEANARLIAAAPELLEAAANLLIWVEKAGEDGAFKNCAAPLGWQKWIKHARAAIAKATRGAP